MKEIAAIALAVSLVAGAGRAGEHPEHPGHHGEHQGHQGEQQLNAKTTPQTVCPIMGDPINKSLYVDHDGKRVYACCAKCLEKLQADPAKYITMLEKQGVTPARVQTTCPVLDGKINKSLYADVDGKRIYVCCAGCIDKIKADPAKYIEKLEAEGVALDSAPTGAKSKSETEQKDQGAHDGHEGHHH